MDNHDLFLLGVILFSVALGMGIGYAWCNLRWIAWAEDEEIRRGVGL